METGNRLNGRNRNFPRRVPFRFSLEDDLHRRIETSAKRGNQYLKEYQKHPITMYRIYNYPNHQTKVLSEERNLEKFIMKLSLRIQKRKERGKSYKRNLYFTEMKPLLIVLRATGRFPYYFTKTGFAPFSLVSWVFLYSCIFNLIFYVLTANSISLMTRNGVYKSNSYDETLYYSLLIFYLLQNFTAPITYWRDAPKTISYFQAWKDLEESWRDDPVITAKRRRIARTLSLVVTPGTIIFVATEAYLLPAMSWIVFVPYAPIIIATCTNLIYWCLTLHELTEFSERLLKGMLQDPGRYDIGYRRKTWLRISELVAGVGQATGVSGLCTLVSMFVSFVLSVYGILVNLTVTCGSSNSYWGLVLCSSYCGGYTYIIVDSAHRASHKIGPKFSLGLMQMDISFLNQNSLNEVDLLIKCIAAKSPVVDYLGFVKLCRNTFVHFVSSTVTYLIVLLQLKSNPQEMSGTGELPEIVDNDTYTTL